MEEEYLKSLGITKSLAYSSFYLRRPFIVQDLANSPGVSLGFLSSLLASSILFSFLIGNSMVDMITKDTKVMRKTLGQKRKAWALACILKEVKFANPKPREALIELDPLEITKATLEVEVDAPPSSVAPSMPITHPWSSSILVKEVVEDSRDH